MGNQMEWNSEWQSQLDGLRAAEMAGTLDKAGYTELKSLIALVETEEQERLTPALERMRAEQSVLRQQVQESQAASEQLAILAVQQERWLADARQLLRELQYRHQMMRQTYQAVVGEPLVAV